MQTSKPHAARGSILVHVKRSSELHAAFEQSPVGIVMARDGGGYVESNPGAAAIHGRPIPQHVSDFSVIDVRDAHGRPVPVDERPLSRALRGEHVAGVELIIRRPDGRDVPVLVDAGPVATLDHERTGAVAIFQDISHFKELEALRAQWNALVVHDLRQPITSIQMRSQALALNGNASESDKQALAAIARTALRLSAMVGDLLDASSLELRQLPLRRGPVRIDDFLRDCAKEAERCYIDRRFEIRTPKLQTDLEATVWADPDRLAQVVENLVSNAVKYSASSTPIGIDCGRAGGSFFISVSNEGEGVSPPELAHLFERFQRSPAARRGIKGTGLGLYITRELVRAHGGEITCVSEPGRTTTFRFTIPLWTESRELHTS